MIARDEWKAKTNHLNAVIGSKTALDNIAYELRSIKIVLALGGIALVSGICATVAVDLYRRRDVKTQ